MTATRCLGAILADQAGGRGADGASARAARGLTAPAGLRPFNSSTDTASECAKIGETGRNPP
jgi:hypothetical protein